jgi:prevent-host-death family protein
MLDFRKNAGKIVKWARNGQRMLMTYRGKPVFKLVPVDDDEPDAKDPFYSLDRLAEFEGEDLSNEDMDAIIYEDK